MAEFYARGLPSVFAADTEFDPGPSRAPFLHSYLRHGTNASPVKNLEWIFCEDLFLDVGSYETSRIITADAERGLRGCRLFRSSKNSATAAISSAVTAPRGISIIVPTR